MANKTVRVYDQLNEEFIDILVTDNGDGTYSQDSSSATEGATSDAAVTTDIAGTISGKLRGLVKLLNSVVDFAAGHMRANILPLRQDIDSVTTFRGAGYIMVDGVAIPILRVKANIAASQTDQVLVAGVAAKKVYVISMFAQAGIASTDLTINSKGGGAGTAISPVFQNGPNTGEVLQRNEDGWFATNTAEALTATTGAGATTGVLILYAQY